MTRFKSAQFTVVGFIVLTCARSALAEPNDSSDSAAFASEARSRARVTTKHAPVISQPQGQTGAYVSSPRRETATPLALRLPLEAGIGLGTELLFGAVGLGAGMVICDSTDADRDGAWFECGGPAAVGGMVGVGVGAVTGVYAGGGLARGNGSFAATALGGGLGLLAGFGAAAAVGDDGSALPLLLAGPLLGSMVGYELTVSSERPPSAARASFARRIGAAPLKNGGVAVSIGGQF